MKRPVLTRDEMIKTVVEAIFAVTKKNIRSDQYGENLFQLGIDSLKAIQIINTIEDKLDIMIDDSQLKKFTTINAIADFFEALPR